MKIGDNIICINSNDSESLEYGHKYTIVDINSHGNLGLKNEAEGCLLAHYYRPCRFMLSPNIQVGQIWKYKEWHIDVILMVCLIGDQDNEYQLININGNAHYPKCFNLKDVFGENINMFVKVADDISEYFAQLSLNNTNNK